VFLNKTALINAVADTTLFTLLSILFIWLRNISTAKWIT